MKPWEETWEADDDRVWDPERRVTIAFGPMDEGCAKLAAAAPEMARLLLELHAGDPGLECPWCEHEPGLRVPHADDCKLIAVLTKAGVLRHSEEP